MSAVTKSGTNQMRGSVFEFHRDDALDSRNFFDERRSAAVPARSVRRHARRPDPAEPAVLLRQPTRGCASATPSRSFARLPNALAHQGFVPDANGVLAQRRRAPDDAAVSRPAVPDSRPARISATARRNCAHSHQDPTDENFGVVKFDYNAGPARTRCMVRWSRDDSKTICRRRIRCSSSTSRTDTRYFTAQYQHLFSSNAAERAPRSPPTAPARTDDLPPDASTSRRRCTSRPTRTSARSTSSTCLDRRIDRDDAGRLQAGRLPGLRHADLEQGQRT